MWEGGGLEERERDRKRGEKVRKRERGTGGT
jgi:hypothetical protein